MPRLSVWMVRTALLHLGVGFTIGALLLSNKGVPYAPLVWTMLGAHIELLLFGWMVQVAMGVAFWILPRFGNTDPDRRYGRVWPAWAGFVLLNVGVLLISLNISILAGRILELLAAVSFIVHVWPRVKAFGT
jgi:hypothetical protein